MPSDPSLIHAGKRAVIIGAGLAGSLLSIYLARIGFHVEVYERRPDPRRHGYAGGRSINLALSVRGLWGLQGVGLAEEILAHEALPMSGRIIHPPPDVDQDGVGTPKPIVYQAYSSRPEDVIYSVSRAGLNIRLLDAAERQSRLGPGSVRFHFEHRCVEVHLDQPAATLIDESASTAGTPFTIQPSDLLLGADGAFSAVRQAITKLDRSDYSQAYLEHGYKELTLPALATDANGSFGRFALDPRGLHIWPRPAPKFEGAMMIALPNRDASFTCTLFWPFGDREDARSHTLLPARKPDEIIAVFQEHYPDAVPLIPDLVEQFQRNPSSSLVTVKCFPWVRHGRTGSTAILGDAAHAIVPFYGQGMNAAFEDVRLLCNEIHHHAGLTFALDRFANLRKPDANAIAEMALENFIEMRDLTADPEFHYRKRLEQAAHDIDPASIRPQYNLVSFSRMRYSEVQMIGRQTARLVEALADRLPRAMARSMPEPQWRDRVAELLHRLLAAQAR